LATNLASHTLRGLGLDIDNDDLDAEACQVAGRGLTETRTATSDKGRTTLQIHPLSVTRPLRAHLSPDWHTLHC
jgi:hypothetical protein